MIQETVTAIGTAKTLYETAKSFLGLAKDLELKQALSNHLQGILSLQNLIIEDRSKYQELLNVKEQLEKKLETKEDWDAYAQNYEFKEIVSDISVYVEKTPQNPSARPKWQCPRCFGKQQKAWMTRQHINHRDYRCPVCDYSIVTQPMQGVRITR